MRAEDANFESMMEGNDSILPTNLQEPPPPLANNTEKQNTEKATPSSRLKSGKNMVHHFFFCLFFSIFKKLVITCSYLNKVGIITVKATL